MVREYFYSCTSGWIDEHLAWHSYHWFDIYKLYNTVALFIPNDCCLCMYLYKKEKTRITICRVFFFLWNKQKCWNKLIFLLCHHLNRSAWVIVKTIVFHWFSLLAQRNSIYGLFTYLNEMKSSTGRKHLCKGVARNVCAEQTGKDWVSA